VLAPVLSEWPTAGRARPPGVRKLADRGCFGNAFRRAHEHGWRYCEGLAVSRTINIEIHHAWCLDDTGRVVETTWRDLGTRYLGAAFELRDVARQHLRSANGRYVEPMSMFDYVTGPNQSMVLVYSARFWDELNAERDTVLSEVNP
jgi:hypothetical protein